MSAGERARLFTAVELPADVADALVALQPPAERGIRPVPRERLHLTLHFIGDAEPDAVSRTLAAVNARPFDLTVTALGMFSRGGRPAALWAGIDDNQRLHALYDAIGDALSAAGYPLDPRPYRPHITLARLTPRARRATIRAFLARAAIDPLTFPVHRFVLLSSDNTDDGPEYTPRGYFDLG